jgi:phage gpG-like protein
MAGNNVQQKLQRAREGFNADYRERSNGLVEKIRNKQGFASDLPVVRALHRIGLLLTSKAKQNVRQQGLIDLGALINSISYDIEQTEDKSYLLRVGSYGLPYARIHEFGGIIRPKNVKNLTIPVAAWAKGRFARQFDLSWAPPPQGAGGNITGRLVNSEGETGFLLASSVKIPARPYLGPALVETRKEIAKILADALFDEVR